MVYLLAPHASALQTERCDWTPIARHIPREPYQEVLSPHSFRHSRQI